MKVNELHTVYLFRQWVAKIINHNEDQRTKAKTN